MQNGDNEIKNKQGAETKEDQNWERKVGGWRDNKTTSRLQADLWLAVHTDKISKLWRRPHPQRTARERGGEAQVITQLLLRQTDRIMQHQHGTEDSNWKPEDSTMGALTHGGVESVVEGGGCSQVVCNRKYEVSRNVATLKKCYNKPAPCWLKWRPRC